MLIRAELNNQMDKRELYDLINSLYGYDKEYHGFRTPKPISETIALIEDSIKSYEE